MSIIKQLVFGFVLTGVLAGVLAMVGLAGGMFLSAVAFGDTFSQEWHWAAQAAENAAR